VKKAASKNWLPFDEETMPFLVEAEE